MTKKGLLRASLPLIIALFSALIAMILGSLPLLITLERKTLDWRMRYRVPDRSFGRGVLVVLLDEALMEQFPCRSPVPRAMLAGLINILSDSGARLIALDVFLKNPSVPEEDRALVEALEKTGKVVLVSALREKEGGYRLDLPREPFLGSALATGVADLPSDPLDQRIRELQAYYDIGEGRIPTLATALFLLGEGTKVLPSKQVDMTAFQTKWPDLPLNDFDRLNIDYQAPPSTVAGGENVISALPASAVITGLVPEDWIRGKVVLIGAGYVDNTDAYRTPFYSPRFDYAMTPGVEIHANALATLQRGKTVIPLSPSLSFSAVLLFCLILLGAERRFNTMVSGVALILCSACYLTLSFVVYEKLDLAIPLVTFGAGLLSCFVLLAVYRSLTEGRQKRWIKNAFQMYLSPEFVNALLKRPDLLFLGGEEKELTILFSDLEGFTSLSEGMSPSELVALLNEYLDGMTRILLSQGGTLDKYEGDAIMAFWGAPLDEPDHAGRAVKAALEMSRFSEALSETFRRKGKPSIRTRIGLNTGKVIVGNIGSESRFNYTIIGDEVNLASRLEGANKAFGTTLMISESTFSRVRDGFLGRELDILRVKGKERPVTVYEVLGFAGEPGASPLQEMLRFYNEGLSRYRRREWQEALGLFERALELRPGDGPSITYMSRCRHFLTNPPAGDWDGVFTLESK